MLPVHLFLNICKNCAWWWFW